MKLPSSYEPKAYESDIYLLWEQSGVFEPKDSRGKGYFSLAAPPPNANANLHIGTGMTLALEDIAVRYNRMLGKSTLFIPGADHAGFETQSVFEKHLAKEGMSRFDYSREELYQKIWDFVAGNRSNFETQFRRLGASFDWNHYTFTLDEKVVAQAYKTFKKMWDDGLIYRGERLVNFCTFHGTAFADIEVEYKEEQGDLWYIRYPLVDGSGEIIVATTRPETMLGDTAVAVNPDDERYNHFAGKTVKLPLTKREIPIISDDFVDKTFGTGAVKITPAHDTNDFEAGKRHDLPLVHIINHEGKITDEAPDAYRGLSVNEARKKVVADLEEQGFLVKTESHKHNVGHCYKCGTVIEPLVRDQWFVDMEPLAKNAIKALKKKEIAFFPDTKRSQLIKYLENLRDWNISRQIAWGIPIPAFQNDDDPDDWIFDTRVEEATIKINDKTYHRDPDVFDTWFSSSSWPYVTLGYPDHEDFKRYYPLSLMETGGEILYPWVSRMIMLGLYVTGKIPFEAVYIHGYVMAEDGSKMSKSIGNVVDPTEIIDRYGSDALRMGLIAGRAPAVNRGYDQRKVEEARNFANKLWNIARYIEGKTEESQHNKTVEPKNSADHWILSKLQQSAESISLELENFRFSEAYETLYHFVWDDFADWYIEASKVEPNVPLLNYVLESVLKIAHPFAPFVTETIWQTLKSDSSEVLAAQLWPKVSVGDGGQAVEFEQLITIVSETRHITKALQVKKPTLYYDKSPLITDNIELLKRLAGVGDVKQTGSGQGLFLTKSTERAWLDIEHQTAMNYAKKLGEQQKQYQETIKRLQSRLDDKNYTSKAPIHLVNQTREQLEEQESLLRKVGAEIETFGATES